MFILGTDPLCLLLVSGIARLGFPRRERVSPGPPLIIRTGGGAVPTTVALISALTKLNKKKGGDQDSNSNPFSVLRPPPSFFVTLSRSVVVSL